MGKADSSDAKASEKKAAKKAKKEAKKQKKEEKRLKKEQKRREKENRNRSQNQEEVSLIAGAPEDPVSVAAPKESIFFLKRVEVSLSLLPASMRNIPAALEDAIRAMIMKYTPKLGVLMTFKNIKVISNNGHGIILNELPFLHYRVSFDGLVFSPRVGCTLQGTVTESFPSHIGVLVLGFFNAMIPSERLTEAGFAFDNDLQEWSKEDGSSLFSKDVKVDFRVDRMHESLGTLSIEGSNPDLSPFGNYPSPVQAEE